MFWGNRQKKIIVNLILKVILSIAIMIEIIINRNILVENRALKETKEIKMCNWPKKIKRMWKKIAEGLDYITYILYFSSYTLSKVYFMVKFFFTKNAEVNNGRSSMFTVSKSEGQHPTGQLHRLNEWLFQRIWNNHQIKAIIQIKSLYKFK